MLTFLVVVYFKMHGNIRKGCTVIVVHKDMPGDSLGANITLDMNIHAYNRLFLEFLSML